MGQPKTFPNRKRPAVEPLEPRQLLSTVKWLGTHASGLWSDQTNWLDLTTNQNRLPNRSTDNLLFPRSSSASVKTTLDDIASLSPNSLEFDDGYTVTGTGTITLGAGGIKLVNPSSITQPPVVTTFQPGQLTLNASTPTSLDSGTELDFLGGSNLAGPGNLATSGAGSLIFLSQQTNNYSGTVATNATIRVGMSTHLPPRPRPRANNAITVGSSGVLSVGGPSGNGDLGSGIVFGDLNPISNIEVDGGEVDVFPGDKLNVASLSGVGTVDPSMNTSGGSGDGVIEIGPTVLNTTSSTPMVFVDSGGAIAPGTAGQAGEIFVNAPVTFASGAVLSIGFVAGTGVQVGSLHSAGTIALNGATLAVGSPPPQAVGARYTIAAAPEIDGQFNGLADGSRVPGVPFVIHYLKASGSGPVTSITLTRLATPNATANFEGAGRSDLAIYLPSLGAYAIRPSGGGADQIIPFGIAGAGQSIPAPGDFDGSGRTELGVYLPGPGYFAYKPAGGGADQVFQFGIAGAGQSLPAIGDYDGDGKSDVAVYLPSLGAFGIRPSRGGPDQIIPFGIAGSGQSIPAPGDYDGDGKTDLAVYLPSMGAFAYKPSGGGPDQIIPFGIAGAGQTIPMPGDYDGSGRTELAVLLPNVGFSVCIFAYRPAGGGPDRIQGFGPSGPGQSIPAPGDYDGDGKTDPTVYLPSIGDFGVRPSGGGADQITQFGIAGAGQSIPVTAASGSPVVSGKAFRAGASPLVAGAVVGAPNPGAAPSPSSKSIAVPAGPKARAARVSVSVATSPTAHRPGEFPG